MMGLAPALGRQNAHDIVYDACRTAASEGRPLYDVLRATPELAGKLSDADLRRLTDPANYLGEAPRTIGRFLASRRGCGAPLFTPLDKIMRPGCSFTFRWDKHRTEL